MKFRGIIFDLDGTLLNSLEDIADASNAALAANGFPTHPVEQYKYFVGDGVRTLVQRILPPEQVNDETVFQNYLAAYLEAYGRNWDNKTQPYPGIPEMLTALQKSGIRMGVFSNKPEQFTKQCVAKLLAPWHFDAVVGQNDQIPPKPDPTGGLLIRDQWGFRSEEILYVGDTATDMNTARTAGFFSIGVAWGFRPISELLASGAKKIARIPSDISMNNEQ
ncbi:MAG: HAD family hydrolase [Planctomycetia bacterium]|nr:HAD family hydrolase [Planctomycetia bacterium]